METDFLFGILTGLVLAFLGYKGYVMTRPKQPAAPIDPKKSGGGYTSDSGIGELPKDRIK
jgi:hypothetical protein